jgi:ribosome biogenesis GTPase A
MNILLLLVIMLATITRQTMAFVSRSSFTQTLRVSSSQQQRSYSRTALSMKLQTAIVGLPNVGKSTLFNALTETQGAEAANYVSF